MRLVRHDEAGREGPGLLEAPPTRLTAGRIPMPVLDQAGARKLCSILWLAGASLSLLPGAKLMFSSLWSTAWSKAKPAGVGGGL